jgi:hypothetical protein
MEVSITPHLNLMVNRMSPSSLFLSFLHVGDGDKETKAHDRPRYYHPKNRVKTPSYYPQTRLRHLTDRALISRLDLDQLFYIFYYREGTYEQYVLFFSRSFLSLSLFFPYSPPPSSLVLHLCLHSAPFLPYNRWRILFKKPMNQY